MTFCVNDGWDLIGAVLSSYNVLLGGVSKFMSSMLWRRLCIDATLRTIVVSLVMD